MLVRRAAVGRTEPLPPDGEPTPFRIGIGVAGRVAQNQKAEIIHDTMLDPNWLTLAPGEYTIPVRSVIAVPLINGSESIGVLILSHPLPRYFTDEQLQLLTTIAGEVSVAVHNSMLYELLTAQSANMAMLSRRFEAEASQYRAIVDSIADGVISVDSEGKVKLVNRAAERIFELSDYDVIGLPLTEAFNIPAIDARYDTMSQLLNGIVQHLREAERRGQRILSVPRPSRFSFSDRTIDARFAPVVTRDGEFAGVVAVFRDITKEVEADRVKSEFISTVSHELRTPMTSIKGYTDLLAMEMAGKLNDHQKEFVKVIKSNTDRLSNLVSDLLDISRIETGRIKLDIRPMQLGEVMSEIMQTNQVVADNKHMALTAEVPEDLPLIMGDRNRVIQILQNLVGNALKYTPKGGSVHIRIREVPADELRDVLAKQMERRAVSVATTGINIPLPELDHGVRVDIVDSGVGISVEDQKKLFTRFFRTDNPLTIEAGGTGLGLSIVKSLVELQRGMIWVESEVNRGSTFSFTIPLAPLADPSEMGMDTQEMFVNAGDQTSLLPRQNLPANGPVRLPILIVDDNQMTASRLGDKLRQAGYEVRITTAAEDTLQVLTSERIGLTAVNMLLPGEMGFKLLHELRREKKAASIAVLLYSLLDSDAGGDVHHIVAGPQDYLTGSMGDAELIACVQHALGKKRPSCPNILLAGQTGITGGRLTRVLEAQGYHIERVQDGTHVLDRVVEQRPDLIVLHIDLLASDGYTAIRYLKRDRDLRSIPLLLLTGNRYPRVPVAGADRGATLRFSDLVAELRRRLESIEAKSAGPNRQLLP